MVKRLWPVLSLVGALLLAAASLHAEEISNRMATRSREVPAASVAPRPGTPIASPIIPGDDDTPNRGGPRGGTGLQPLSTVSAGDQADSGKLYDVLAYLRHRWLALLVLFR